MSLVLKVGGSLDADPGRRQALLRAVAEGAHGPCIVVPGGGAAADAVRAAQGREGFGDAEAHRRALDAMGANAARFRRIEPRLAPTREPWRERRPASPPGRVWDPAALRPGRPDIPETWDVTSDSLALWLAAQVGADLCALAKSTDAPPGRTVGDLADLGLVDPAFPAFAARFSGRVELWGPAGRVRLATTSQRATGRAA